MEDWKCPLPSFHSSIQKVSTYVGGNLKHAQGVNHIQGGGVRNNMIRLVRKAIRLRKQDDYDQVWCVFDRDSFPRQNFNDALDLARQAGIEVAYSNEAFEIWYLLHFHYHDSATSRDLYKGMLTDRLGFEYKKNDPTMYDLLERRQQDAIRNAERLLSFHVPHRPADDNPCTTVHHLVQALNEFAV